MPANVEVTTTIGFEDLDGRLRDAERAVLARFERKILRYVRGEWTGWTYKGRPKNAPRNVSYRAWKSTLQTTQAPYSLDVTNEARDYRAKQPYVAYVHRSGDPTPEFVKLSERIAADIVPEMAAAFAAEIRRTLEPRPRKKLRSRGTTPRVTRSLER